MEEVTQQIFFRATMALLAWIEISHTELENKLKIIISKDENDSLAAKALAEVELAASK